ncbi:hypothetical protein [Corynebacterium sp. NML130628]|uniref:hypothetical protein n=1 Tax=Corynebacterium sp. NML130628 TaxID=1906333 RepID=UPI0008FB0D46|nr:hypothetical protein [Corynebacterium sp. NML130628]OIR46459.1 hypothetical protein BJP07_00045 [Corynebacterium sp. NML130628]
MQRSGQGSAIQSTVRQVGSALGTAISGSVFSMALAIALPKTLTAAGTTTRQPAGSSMAQLRAEGVTNAFGDQTAAVVQALSEGMADAARWSLLAATAFLALGFVGALQVRRAAGGGFLKRRKRFGRFSAIHGSEKV